MITNHHNIPAQIVDLITAMRAEYNSGCGDNPKCISVTQLVSPPQMFALKQAHGEADEDAINLMPSMLGTNIHGLLERLSHLEKYTGHMFEERLTTEFDGWTITGQLDYFNPNLGHLDDYKYTSCYSFRDELKPEWRRQANLLKWLLERHTWTVESMAIVAVARDWSSLRASKDTKYPQIWSKSIPVPLYPNEKIEAWLTRRLKEQEGPIRPCTDEEKYAAGGNWAAMKNGNTRATKLFDTELECKDWIATQNDADKFSVEARRPEFHRCQSYCNVRYFCQQAINEGSWPNTG